MSRFNTLLQREWMQHSRGWLILMLALPALVLVLTLLPFGTVEPGSLQPLELMLITTVATTLLVLLISAASVAIQASGLARRDQQDRSIEFWLSLPTSHSASIGAMLLMHFLLVPLLALALGALCSQVLALAIVSKGFGVGAWFGLPWASLLLAGAAALVRGAFGVVLAMLWLLPLVLTMMAASAWLKRWGVPVLVVLLTAGHAVLAAVYGITVIGNTFAALTENAARALLHGSPIRLQGERSADLIVGLLSHAPQWLARDALASLADLAQPLFVFALAVSAACFALLVLRRSRNG